MINKNIVNIKRIFKVFKVFKVFTVLLLLLIIISCFLNGCVISDFFGTEKDMDLSGKFAVHFIDVGQGDSILVQSPNNDFMLIDTGPGDAYNKLSSYFDNFGVSKFKYVIFTHPHADHIGSADKIVKNHDIETLIMPVAVNTSKTFERLITEIENKDLQITPPERGTVYQFGGAELTILAPLSESYKSLNNYSVVVHITYGETAFLFTGDMEKESENEIIAYCKEIGDGIYADVLKVSHHGSSTSSPQKFLELIIKIPAACGGGLR